MKVLIIAEHNNQQLESSTLHAIYAGNKLGVVDVLVTGKDTSKVVNILKKISEVNKVLFSEAEYYEHGLPEEITPLIVSLAKDYQVIATSASSFGKNVMPRVAALLDIIQLSDVIEIIDNKTFVRPIYAGNAYETLQVNDDKFVLTFRETAFSPVKLNNGNAEILRIEALPQIKISKFISNEVNQSERPDLSQAKVVVSGGRALGSKENFEKLIFPLADVLEAAIGASRAAVDAEYAPNDIQVGQTGKIVAPELYIAIGISGAIQHIAGMQDSKTIVAINKDPDALIFNNADIGLVGDLFDIVPKLTQLLKN